MSNLINNFVNYLYLKERSRKKNVVIEQCSEKYLHKTSVEKLGKEQQLKIIYF